MLLKISLEESGAGVGVWVGVAVGLGVGVSVGVEVGTGVSVGSSVGVEVGAGAASAVQADTAETKQRIVINRYQRFMTYPLGSNQ